MEQSALGGLRVLDLSDSAAGAWCGYLLAALGADVALAEPPGGHTLRRCGPFDAQGRSIPAAYLLANRRSIALDLEDSHDAEVARRLAARSDILLSGSRPARLGRLRLRYDDLAAPQLVMVHLTPWGMTGDWADAPGNDLAVAARSGWASLNGRAGREPLKPSGWQVSYCTGTAAFIAAVAAIIARDDGLAGGQEIDIAAVEVMASAFSPAVLRTLYTGQPLRRHRETDILTGPVPVADGHFALTISRAHFWRDAMNLLGLTDLASDPRWERGWYRQQHKNEYVQRVQERMREWPKWDLFHELGARRVIAGPVLSMEELHASEHLRSRRFWRRPAGDEKGPLYPGPPFRMSRTPPRLRCGPPAPDEHGGELRSEAGS